MSKLPAPYRLPNFEIMIQGLKLPTGLAIDKHVYCFKVDRTEAQSLAITTYNAESKENINSFISTIFKHLNLDKKRISISSEGNKILLQFYQLDDLDKLLTYCFLHNSSINSGATFWLRPIQNNCPSGQIRFYVSGGKFYVGVQSVYQGHDDSPQSPELLAWLGKELRNIGIFSSEQPWADLAFDLDLSEFNAIYEQLSKASSTERPVSDSDDSDIGSKR